MSREESYAPKSPDLSSFYAAPEPVPPPNQNSQPSFLPYTAPQLQHQQWSSYPQQLQQPLLQQQQQQQQQPPYYHPPAHLRSPSQQNQQGPYHTQPQSPTSQPAQSYYVPPGQAPFSPNQLPQPQQPQHQLPSQQQQQRQQQQPPFAVQQNYYPSGPGANAYYQPTTQQFPQQPQYQQGLQQVLQQPQPPVPPPAPAPNLEPGKPMPPRKAAVAATAANAAAAAAEAAQSSDGGSNGGVGKPAVAPSPVKTKFPTARIKRIMQADEEVGKVSQQTPIAVGKALELFMVSIVTESAEVARSKNSKRVTAQMLRQVVEAGEQWDFLRDIVKKVDLEEKPHGGRPRGSTGGPATAGDGSGGAKTKLESDSDTEQPKKRGRPGRKKKEA